MELAEVRKLVKLVEASNIEELELERDGARIRVRKASPVSAPATTYVAAAAPAAVPAAPAPAPAVEASAPATPAETVSKKYHEIKSPMVGTFYRAPAPDADPYVQVGDPVKPGQTLCIVEAMKLMNEIESDVAGRVVEIVMENADPVEFGQAMILIDPQG